MADDAAPDGGPSLPQGDLRLLDKNLARRLLAATVPARYAYLAGDGTPRVLPSWFHWTGEELVMPAFLAAPYLRGPAWVGLLDFQTRLPSGFAQ